MSSRQGFPLVASGECCIAQSWTNAAAVLLPEIYWPCMGVSERYIAAIKEQPSFVRSRVDAYASTADLESEKRHVTCFS